MVAVAPKLTTGRRKGAVARVRLTPGDGGFTVNGRPVDDYFPTRVHRMVARGPLTAIERERDYDVTVTIRGGGIPAGRSRPTPGEPSSELVARVPVATISAASALLTLVIAPKKSPVGLLVCPVTVCGQTSTRSTNRDQIRARSRMTPWSKFSPAGRRASSSAVNWR